MKNETASRALLASLASVLESIFAGTVFSFVAMPQLASATMCAHLVGTCEYYDCVENELLACGSRGYTLSYGKFYCEKFEAVRPRSHITPHERELFPVEWEQWLSKTANCLHSAIDNYFEANPFPTCNALRESAFASHASCYTSGDSFCFLPPRQIANIGRIISVRGFSRPETIAQVSETAAICVQQIDNRIRVETSPLSRLELSTYRNAWALIAER
jgi:hypothetical protein